MSCTPPSLESAFRSSCSSEELYIKLSELGQEADRHPPAGFAILEHVETVLDSIKNMQQATREFSNVHRGILSIITEPLHLGSDPVGLVAG